MCRCDFSDMLFTPPCDYVWAVARYDHADRLWRLTVEHKHSDRTASGPHVGSFTDSGDASQWLSLAFAALLERLEDDFPGAG